MGARPLPFRAIERPNKTVAVDFDEPGQCPTCRTGPQSRRHGLRSGASGTDEARARRASYLTTNVPIMTLG